LHPAAATGLPDRLSREAAVRLRGCNGTMRGHVIAAVPLVALGALAAPTAAAAPTPAESVSVYLTDLGANTFLAPQPALSWRRAGQPPAGATITVDTRRRYQPITGFGASFTDSSAWLVGTRLDSEERDAVMRDLFSRQGIGLSFLRQPM